MKVSTQRGNGSVRIQYQEVLQGPHRDARAVLFSSFLHSPANFVQAEVYG